MASNNPKGRGTASWYADAARMLEQGIGPASIAVRLNRPLRSVIAYLAKHPKGPRREDLWEVYAELMQPAVRAGRKGTYTNERRRRPRVRGASAEYAGQGRLC